MRSRLFLVGVLILTASHGLRLHAWDAQAHRQIARLAWSQMTDEAKRASTTLLGNDNFITSSTWADEVRSRRKLTSNWHAVRIPYSATTYDPARDCALSPTLGDCIIGALGRAEQQMLDVSRSVEQRQEALKTLIHLVGDLHQPLNAIDLDGRAVKTTADSHWDLSQAVSLSNVWNRLLVGARSADDESAMTELTYHEWLLKDLAAHPVSPGPIDFVQWALESHALAITAVYSYPGFSPSGPAAGSVRLSEAYLLAGRATVDRQLEVAGVRLAEVLNAAFAAQK